MLVVANRDLTIEIKRKLITNAAAAVHLNDQVIPIGTLLIKERLRPFRISINFLNPWIACKLNKPVNVA